MHRVAVVIAVVAVVCASRDAAADGPDDSPSAYLAISYGVTVRRIPDPAAPSRAVARGGGPPAAGPGASTTVSILQRFALALSRHVYVGSEVEVAQDDEPDRSPERPRMAAGAGLVAGVMATARPFKLGAELAGGWRVLYEAPDEAVLEARVHGELWLSPWLTVGVGVGSNVVDRGDWITAFYIGLHTRRFGE